jgi:tetratricopeptide (TPR) repeat protein
MLSEEALVLVGFFVAAGFLVLGVLELLWPSKPRQPAHRPASPAPRGAPTLRTSISAPEPGSATVLPAPPEPRAGAPERTPPRKRRSKVSPHSRPHAGHPLESPRTGGGRGEPAGPLVAPPPIHGPEASPLPKDLVPAGPAPEALEADVPLDRVLVDRCFALQQEGQHATVVALGVTALEQVGGALQPVLASDVAALWSLVGLSRRALGDEDGAWQALERAVASAPADDRPRYEQHLTDLALGAARSWLARQEGEDRLAAVHAALTWLGRGLAVAPADPALREARAEAREALWPAYAEAAEALVGRGEFAEARGLLQEALAEPDVPAARGEAFREMLAVTYSGEVGQLTAQAIVVMQEARDADALGLLERAEALLGAIPNGTLSGERRSEVDQRLWWAYTKLGMRRVDGGNYEAALSPLMRALRFPTIGPERREETHATLATALGGVADERAQEIRRLSTDDDRDAARERLEELRGLLHECADLGLTTEDLAEAHATVRQLLDELGGEGSA